MKKGAGYLHCLHRGKRTDGRRDSQWPENEIKNKTLSPLFSALSTKIKTCCQLAVYLTGENGTTFRGGWWRKICIQHRGSFNPLVLSVWKKNGKPVGLVDMVLRNIIASFRWNASSEISGRNHRLWIGSKFQLIFICVKKSPDGTGGCV